MQVRKVWLAPAQSALLSTLNGRDIERGQATLPYLHLWELALFRWNLSADLLHVALFRSSGTLCISGPVPRLSISRPVSCSGPELCGQPESLNDRLFRLCADQAID